MNNNLAFTAYFMLLLIAGLMIGLEEKEVVETSFLIMFHIWFFNYKFNKL